MTGNNSGHFSELRSCFHPLHGQHTMTKPAPGSPSPTEGAQEVGEPHRRLQDPLLSSRGHDSTSVKEETTGPWTIESPETDPQEYSQSVFDKGGGGALSKDYLLQL